MGYFLAYLAFGAPGRWNGDWGHLCVKERKRITASLTFLNVLSNGELKALSC